MLVTLSLIITISAVSLLAIAAFSDIKTLRIPNAVCAAIAVLGLLRLILTGDLSGGLYTIACGIIIFLIGLVLFARRMVGGGDVKLLTATVPLIGCYHLFPFLMLMSVCGGVLALAVLILRYTPLPVYLGCKFAAFATTTELVLPYGVAIAIASVVMLLFEPLLLPWCVTCALVPY